MQIEYIMINILLIRTINLSISKIYKATICFIVSVLHAFGGRGLWWSQNF